MVRDYTTALYEPAAASRIGTSPPTAAAAAIALADWRRRVDEAGKAVAVTSVDLDDSAPQAGTTRTVTVTVELGELTVDDVRVEAVHGPLGHDGEFREPVEIAELQPTGGGVFTGEIAIGVAGSYGVSACAFPVHRDLASPFDVGRVAWAD